MVVLVWEMDSEAVQDVLGNTLASARHPLDSGERE